jgi:hypothetical protein
MPFIQAMHDVTASPARFPDCIEYCDAGVTARSAKK